MSSNRVYFVSYCTKPLTSFHFIGIPKIFNSTGLVSQLLETVAPSLLSRIKEGQLLLVEGREQEAVTQLLKFRAGWLKVNWKL